MLERNSILTTGTPAATALRLRAASGGATLRASGVPFAPRAEVLALLALVVGAMAVACGGGGGSDSAGKAGAKPVIASFVASPTTIDPGGSSTLEWSITGATAASLADGPVDARSGTLTVRPSVTTTYVLTATGATDSTTALATVTVRSTAGTCSAVDRTSPGTPLTTCTQTSNAEGLPACTGQTASPLCPGQQMGGAAPANRCGAITACPLERSLAVDGVVSTTYTPGPANYRPPEPPHDAEGLQPLEFGKWNHALTTAWAYRPLTDPSRDPMHLPNDIGSIDSLSCGIYNRDLMLLAIPEPLFGQNANPGPDVWNLGYWCGACAEVVGPTGKRVRVQVATQRSMDPAPAPTAGNYYSIDLYANASYLGDTRKDTPFDLIIGDGDGSCTNDGVTAPPVTYRIVPCEVCGGVVLQYVPGFNAGTPSFRFHNHRLPIVDAYIQRGSTWERMQRDSVNQWQPRSPPNPMRLRIVAIDGAVIEGSFPPYAAGKSYETTSQF